MKVKDLIKELEYLNESGLGDLDVCTEDMHDMRYFETLTGVTLSMDEGDYLDTPAVLISLCSPKDFKDHYRKLDEFDLEKIRKAMNESYEGERDMSALVFPN